MRVNIVLIAIITVSSILGLMLAFFIIRDVVRMIASNKEEKTDADNETLENIKSLVKANVIAEDIDLVEKRQLDGTFSFYPKAFNKLNIHQKALFIYWYNTATDEEKSDYLNDCYKARDVTAIETAKSIAASNMKKYHIELNSNYTLDLSRESDGAIVEGMKPSRVNDFVKWFNTGNNVCVDEWLNNIGCFTPVDLTANTVSPN